MKLFCILNFHFWKYSKEKVKITGHPANRETIRIPMRECSCCKKRQHHMKPLVQNNIISYKWQDFNIAKDEAVTYKEIQDIRGVLQDYK